jgi:hypothetical protein
MMKPFFYTILLAATCYTSPVSANMGALIIIPKDPKPVFSLHLGQASSSTDIDRNSTLPALNTGTISYDDSPLFWGGAIGLQNSYYRFSFSYDNSNGDDVKLQRYLMNFDFRLGYTDKLLWRFGTGIGVGRSSYDLDGRSFTQSNGIVCFRGGTEYLVSKHTSVELIVEYSLATSKSSTTSYYSVTDYTSYQIDNQNSLIMRMGLNYCF